MHRAARGMPYAPALLNLWAAFTGGTQGQALLTVPIDAPVPKLSTGGCCRHFRVHTCSCVQQPVHLVSGDGLACGEPDTRVGRREVGVSCRLPEAISD